MTTTDTLLPSDMPKAPERPKRSRFARERFGAWLFAASFSIGIWGLALKILTPSHPAPAATSIPHYAVLAPSDADDGRATVVWGTGVVDPAMGYPITDGMPVTTSNPPNGAGSLGE